MDMLVDVIAESVLDTLELVPFLFVTYLAMEALEHSTGGRMQGLVARAGHAGPVVGSLLGAIPQCGFSAMAATLFSGGVVTVGTLVAVVLSTSDEMVPVFLAHQEPVGRLLSIMLLKVVVGIVVGLLLDAFLHAVRHVGTPQPHIHDLCERAHCHCEEDESAEQSAPVEQGAGDATHGHHHHGHSQHECRQFPPFFHKTSLLSVHSAIVCRSLHCIRGSRRAPRPQTRLLLRRTPRHSRAAVPARARPVAAKRATPAPPVSGKTYRFLVFVISMVPVWIPLLFW